MHAKAPVIVVDLQTGMFDGRVGPALHDAEGLVARVRRILSWARGSGHAVAFIQQNSPAGDQLAPGAEGWPIWPALGQAAAEPTFVRLQPRNCFRRHCKRTRRRQRSLA